MTTTITLPRAVVEQALETLENEHRSPRGYGYELSVYEMRETSAAITALRAALAEPVQAKLDHETRAELAEQQVVQLAEERDHYRNLWLKAQQAEPVAWVHTDAHNPKVRFLEWTQQAKGYRGDWIKTPLCNCAPPRQSDPQVEDRLARHGIPKP